MKIFKKTKKGFTLVELVVVIAVIAILAAVSVGAYFGVTESANNSKLEQEAKQVYTAIQTVALAPNDYSNLNTSGLVILDATAFEGELEESLGRTVVLTSEDKKDGNEPTIYFSSEEYIEGLTGGTTVYKTFEYHLPEINGKAARVNVVTGEVKVEASDVEAGDNAPTTTVPGATEPIAIRVELSEYNISLNHNSEGYPIYADVYDQYDNKMDVLGEWVLLGENNAVAYSPTQGINRLVIWGQSTGTVKFEFVYNNIKSDVLTVNVVVSQEFRKTVVIADYADANSWANSVKYETIKIDENVCVSAAGGGDTGKYYVNGENRRIYQSEDPTITFTAVEGYVIDSIVVIYTINNDGVLTFDGANIASAESVDIDARTAVFSVGNTGTAKNGQVRITSIEVIYINN